MIMDPSSFFLFYNPWHVASILKVDVDPAWLLKLKSSCPQATAARIFKVLYNKIYS